MYEAILKSKKHLVLALLTATLHAQVGTSVLTGRIVDATDSAIPNVEVKVVNEASGSTTAVRTNGEGIYRATALLPGTYRLEVNAIGFDPVIRRNVVVEVAQTLSVDFSLQVGQQNQAIEVSEDVSTIETQSSSIAQVVNHKMIDNLPIPNRAASSLVNLSPGAVLINSGEGGENYPVFSVAGGRARNQYFTLDGGNVTGADGVTRPQQQASLPLDAMQEFRVISNNYSAEYGHSTGGIIALSTRSGTNEYHGSIFEFARNNALDARNFFAAATPPLNLHQFGGAIGGPIIKSTTHFFASWEETRSIDPAYPCCTFRGSITAFRSSDGSVLWKSFVVDPPKRTGQTPAGTPTFGPSGAGVDIILLLIICLLTKEPRAGTAPIH